MQRLYDLRGLLEKFPRLLNKYSNSSLVSTFHRQPNPLEFRPAWLYVSMSENKLNSRLQSDLFRFRFQVALSQKKISALYLLNYLPRCQNSSNYIPRHWLAEALTR